MGRMSDDQDQPGGLPFPFPAGAIQIDIGNEKDPAERFFSKISQFEMDAYRFLTVAAVDQHDEKPMTAGIRIRWKAVEATLNRDLPSLIEACREWLTEGSIRHGAPENPAESLGVWMLVNGEIAAIIEAARDVRENIDREHGTPQEHEEEVSR